MIFPHNIIALAAGCDWAHPKMMSPKSKAKKKPPKDSITLLPCFYFVEVCADYIDEYKINASEIRIMLKNG